jgi:hypothetical protein
LEQDRPIQTFNRHRAPSFLPYNPSLAAGTSSCSVHYGCESLDVGDHLRWDHVERAQRPGEEPARGTIDKASLTNQRSAGASRASREASASFGVNRCTQPVHRDVVDLDAALDEKFLHVAVGQAVAQYQRTATTITSAGNRNPAKAQREQTSGETELRTSPVNPAR